MNRLVPRKQSFAQELGLLNRLVCLPVKITKDHTRLHAIVGYGVLLGHYRRNSK
jgi:hypothetical protein